MSGDGISDLSPEQISHIDALLDAMLDLPEMQRLSALRGSGVDDPRVVAEVESLLHAVQASANFLSAPARPAVDERVQDPMIGARLSAWRMRRLIGRGGMGDVYEALRDDGEFEQRVAIKLLQREAGTQLQRFQAERQILARLDHPGIARLYDGGVTDDGRPYMVMEYIEGLPITDFCSLNAATFEQRLRLFVQVCEAVSFAHRNRVVHRDLKPSNILVTSQGVVKLLDFGIAKLLDPQIARVTQALAAPMTPSCAAPEQITGDPITSATDVYALGLLLFELMTGTHPWMGADTPVLQAIRSVLDRPAPVASRWAQTQGHAPVPVRLIRGDVDAIVAKALRKVPDHRYASVAALELDIARALRGDAVEARQGARLYAIGRAIRRYRWAAATAILMAAILGAEMSLRVAPSVAPPAPKAVVAHTVAVVAFSNLSQKESDSWLAPALTEMLNTELSAAENIRVVPDELVRDVLKGLKISPAGRYGPNTLAQLGEHLGTEYVLAGSYLMAPPAEGSPLRVDISLQNARTGAMVSSFSQQVALSDLTRLVSHAGDTLRNSLGAKAPSQESLARVESAQPPSLDVARRMGVAHDDIENYRPAQARDELLEAVAESPGYAPAYLQLSQAWSALGDRQKAVAAAEQSESRAEALPPEQRLLVAATLQAGKYQWAEAAKSWNTLVKARPEVPEYRLRAIDALLASGAMAAAQSAMAELRRLPNTADDPRIELAAARIANTLDDSKVAAEHAEHALHLAEARNTPELMADARMQLGSAQSHLGLIDAANTALRAAIEGYHLLGNLHGEAEARRRLAMLFRDQNRGTEARQEYQRAMQINKEIGNVGGIASVYRDLCEMLWEAGDRDGALAAARRALQISREIGDLKLQAWTLRAIASIASDDSASDEVMRDYREVTALTERTGDRGGHVWSLATYAEAARLRGEMTEAETTCEKALAEAAVLTDPQFAIYSTYTCALVALDQGQYERARSMLDTVERQSVATRNHVYLGNAQTALAQIDMEESNCRESIGRLRKAIGNFVAAEAATGEANAQALYAVCAQSLGDPAARDAALTRARALRSGITMRLEVYYTDIVSLQLGSAGDSKRDAIARLERLASDAAQRHWIAWSLEAKLGAWELAQAAGYKDEAHQLHRDLSLVAREHGMGRILSRIEQAGNR